MEPRDADCAAKLKQRTLISLYNESAALLDLAHQKRAAAAAYGSPADLTDEQILERLPALNPERATEEAKSAKVKKPKTSRAKHPDEMIWSAWSSPPTERASFSQAARTASWRRRACFGARHQCPADANLRV